MSTAGQDDGARPVRVAVVNDYEIVVAGIAAALEPFAERVTVVEITAGLPVISDVDVVLYDTFAQRRGGWVPVERLVGEGTRLVVFSWNGDHDLVEEAIKAGASGFISKSTTAADLVEALVQVHAGVQVVPEEPSAPAPDPDDARQEVGRWPGAEAGLSPRESEVLALICRGMSNDEITSTAFIGINTVKTHIRTLYRKIGVSRRTQAVLWGHAHGFEADRLRDLDP